MNQEGYSDHLKDYEKIYSVGIDIKATSFDENCANFCLDRKCDFLTTDKKSYSHFFKIRQVKSVQIFQFMKKEPKIDRPVYCMRIKIERNEIKTITKEQMGSLQTKTAGNISRMLDFLYQVIGSPEEKKGVVHNVHVYECYAVFTHAVEEYGKLLYLKMLTPDDNGNYKIKYSEIFTNHVPKFRYALEKLPESIKVVHQGDFAYENYDSESHHTDVLTTWINRLNVLNTDIDDDGNPTNISFNVNMDKLRQCVLDFRNFLTQ